MQSVLQDLRYGIRTLAKTPGVAILIIVTLSLGIGSSTLLFNMVRQWLFSAVTFPHSEQSRPSPIVYCFFESVGAGLRPTRRDVHL